MPRNIVIASTAMVTSVAAAFRLSGGRNAGTPFETASTPVMAVQPFENAVSSGERRQAGRVPDLQRVDGLRRPQASREVAPRADAEQREDAADEEVGGNGEDATRLPDAAEVADVKSATRPRAISTRFRCHAGRADVIAATPAATLTATVST